MSWKLPCTYLSCKARNSWQLFTIPLSSTCFFVFIKPPPNSTLLPSFQFHLLQNLGRMVMAILLSNCLSFLPLLITKKCNLLEHFVMLILAKLSWPRYQVWLSSYQTWIQNMWLQIQYMLLQLQYMWLNFHYMYYNVFARNTLNLTKLILRTDV